MRQVESKEDSSDGKVGDISWGPSWSSISFGYKETEWLGVGAQSLLGSLNNLFANLYHWLVVIFSVLHSSQEDTDKPPLTLDKMTVQSVVTMVPQPSYPISDVESFLRAQEDEADEGIVVAGEEDSSSDYGASPIPTSVLEFSPQRDSELSRRDSDLSSPRRDSDLSSCGCSEEDVAERILSQVEAMFSDDHLAKDGFLLKHVRRRSDGFVSLKLVAGLRKVKQISREFNTVLTALQNSQVLEVNPEGTKVRRKEPLSCDLKALPIKQAKKEKSNEKENVYDEHNPLTTQEISRENNKSGNTMRKNSNAGNNAMNSRRNSQSVSAAAQRKISAGSVSSGMSSGYSSRHSSISGGRPHPADLFRNLMTSSLLVGEESPRRRGGSLPQKGPLSGSPPGVSSGFLRPKSNSYCEGTSSSTSMSPWLLRRKASVASTRLSTGEIQISGVIRQPRGPDGTKGFQSGYRALILQQRLAQSQSNAQTC